MTFPVEFVRRLGLCLVAGALAGFLAGGVGGRLFMSVLAGLNPEAAGVTSDDGFTIGQVTLQGTLSLFGLCTVIGTVGGLLWFVLRGLRFGPRWWRLVSMPIGVGIVVGAQLVHSVGVDFTLLGPPALTIGLTVAVPVVAALLVSAIGDRLIGSDETTWQLVPAVFPWTARALLVALILFSLTDLVRDVRIIV